MIYPWCILTRTNRFEAFEYDSRFFINPGSATGAFSPLWTPGPTPPSTEEAEAVSDVAPIESETTKPATIESTFPPNPTPSFALLDIQGLTLVTYVYQLVKGEVRVEKIEFRKGAV